MSGAKTTKVFGMTVKADPKFLLGGLAVVLIAALWFNFRTPAGEEAPASSRTTDVAATPAPFVRDKGRNNRRREMVADRGVLRIRPVDASDGRIDPTLRTDLLTKLQSLQAPAPARSLFEIGASPQPGAPGNMTGPTVPVNRRPVPVAPAPVIAQAPQAPQVNIPLRYYGFVNPADKHEAARGLFMSGDNIVVAKEGDELENRYLVVALNPQHARMEDTQLRQGEILPVAPEAQEQQ